MTDLLIDTNIYSYALKRGPMGIFISENVSPDCTLKRGEKWK